MDKIKKKPRAMPLYNRTKFILVVIFKRASLTMAWLIRPGAYSFLPPTGTIWDFGYTC